MASKPSEAFSRLTDSRILELLQKISLERNLPIELLIFSKVEAADILNMSKRSLDTLIAERRISYAQKKRRGKVTFSSQDILDYHESIKISRL
jgi:hypothetical protein